MKICSTCKTPREATLDNFSKKLASPDGLNSRCKDCDKETSAQYRANNPDEANASSKRSKQKHSVKVKARRKTYYEENSVQIMEQMKEALKKNPERGLLKLAKQRCKKSGVVCTITEKDIVIPEFCPILGVKLGFGDMATRDNSPSLDRIQSELGYIPGNVAVISFKANRIKNHGSADQHRRIADWMDSVSQPEKELVAA